MVLFDSIRFEHSTSSTTAPALSTADQSTASSIEAAAQAASQPSTSTTEAAPPEPLSITKIESSLPPLRGATVNFAGHVEKHNENAIHLEKFYNGKMYTFKKHKRMTKKARQEEFYKLADSLLRMVGGSIGEKKKKDQIVVVGIGMGGHARLAIWSSEYTSIIAARNAPPANVLSGRRRASVAFTAPLSQVHAPGYHGKAQHRQYPQEPRGEPRETAVLAACRQGWQNYPWHERGRASTAGQKDAPGPSQQATSTSSGTLKRQAKKGSEPDLDKATKRTKATVAKQG
ncbi:hypothetical protein BGZ96_003761 [Linnemannia gamsii]|uniref:Uncharacterized protein n=1 Tax=Linnemannia gamsii TaxID=64522 RepID=A0ABQ7K858_9FUNG|nr:hypothetical protein BGZ96_003761 [Linnemannia gamsii]